MIMRCELCAVVIFRFFSFHNLETQLERTALFNFCFQTQTIRTSGFASLKFALQLLINTFVFFSNIEWFQRLATVLVKSSHKVTQGNTILRSPRRQMINMQGEKGTICLESERGAARSLRRIAVSITNSWRRWRLV